jgi:hypothetical protein
MLVRTKYSAISVAPTEKKKCEGISIISIVHPLQP